VAEGYDTFNIVFMAIGDSHASECFSMSSMADSFSEKKKNLNKNSQL